MKKLSETPQAVGKRRRLAETGATLGMLLIGVGLLLPLFNMLHTETLYLFRWIFAAGALMFWVARSIPVSAADDSTRLRRLRRMEFWSGACFGVAAFFWFYNCAKYGNAPHTGALMILRDTIMFSLAGAVLQLVAAWMIYYRQKKDAEATAGASGKKKGGK